MKKIGFVFSLMLLLSLLVGCTLIVPESFSNRGANIKYMGMYGEQIYLEVDELHNYIMSLDGEMLYEYECKLHNCTDQQINEDYTLSIRSVYTPTNAEISESDGIELVLYDIKAKDIIFTHIIDYEIEDVLETSFSYPTILNVDNAVVTFYMNAYDNSSESQVSYSLLYQYNLTNHTLVLLYESAYVFYNSDVFFDENYTYLINNSEQNIYFFDKKLNEFKYAYELEPECDEVVAVNEEYHICNDFAANKLYKFDYNTMKADLEYDNDEQYSSVIRSYNDYIIVLSTSLENNQNSTLRVYDQDLNYIKTIELDNVYYDFYIIDDTRYLLIEGIQQANSIDNTVHWSKLYIYSVSDEMYYEGEEVGWFKP